MKSVIKDVFRLRHMLVLQLEWIGEEPGSFSAFELKLSGDHMQVLQEKAGLKGIYHFSKLYKARTVVLCLSGKGILSKRIAAAGISDQEVFSRAIPNAKPEDFYQQLRSTGESVELTVLRKERADPLIAELKESGFEVLALCLGPEAAERNNLVRLMLDVEALKVGDPLLEEKLEQERAKAKFQGLAMVSAAVLLPLLLINFFLFMHYSDELASLQRQQQISGQQVRKFQGMEDEISAQTRFIQSAGWTGGYPYAWITDRLMASKPAEIRISGFWINPARAVAGNSTVVDYESGRLKLSGLSAEAAVLNNWLHALRAMNWLKRCDMVGYQLNKDSGAGEFTVEIELNAYEL